MVKASPELPEIDVDPHPMAQVLGNLVGNPLQSSKASGVFRIRHLTGIKTSNYGVSGGGMLLPITTQLPGAHRFEPAFDLCDNDWQLLACRVIRGFWGRMNDGIPNDAERSHERILDPHPHYETQAPTRSRRSGCTLALI